MVKRYICALLVVILSFGVYTPAMAANATPSTATVYIDGERIPFEAYNIDGSNYFKLRDVAAGFDGSWYPFEVTWDNQLGAIDILTDKSYTHIGGELTRSGSGAYQAEPSDAAVFIDGQRAELKAYLINGYNYFKLADLCAALNVYIAWYNPDRAIYVDTAEYYAGVVALNAPLQYAYHAQPNLNYGAAKTVDQLEEKFGITIDDMHGYLRGNKSAEYIALLDKTMDLFGVEVMWAIADYYAGYDMDFILTVREPTKQAIAEDSVAYAFEDEYGAGIELYVPGIARGIDGMNVATIAHELGHIVHYIAEYEGDEDIESAFIGHNKGLAYDEDGSSYDKPNGKYVFVNDYASTSYYEDIASIFEYLAAEPNTIQKWFADNAYAPILKKAQLLKRLILSQFDTFGPILDLIP